MKPNTYLGKLCRLNHVFESTQQSLRYKCNYNCVICVKLKPKNRKKEAEDAVDNLFYLGNLCPRGHNYNETGRSLRYKSNFDCKECSGLLRRERNSSRTRIYPGKNDPRPKGIPIPDGYYLGLLCKRGHDYMQTGYSLRSDRRTCVICISLRSREPQARERCKKWKDENPDYMVKYLRAYYQENKPRLLQYSKEYSKTPKGKALKRIDRHKRRARISAVVRLSYTASELVAHFQAFNNECVYCGSTESLTGDHVIPIAKGGHDALSNILPSCLSCNCSKQDRDYLEWYLKSPYFNLERLAKIANFIGDNRAKESQNYDTTT